MPWGRAPGIDDDAHPAIRPDSDLIGQYRALADIGMLLDQDIFANSQSRKLDWDTLHERLRAIVADLSEAPGEEGASEFRTIYLALCLMLLDRHAEARRLLDAYVDSGNPVQGRLGEVSGSSTQHLAKSLASYAEFALAEQDSFVPFDCSAFTTKIDPHDARLTINLLFLLIQKRGHACQIRRSVLANVPAASDSPELERDAGDMGRFGTDLLLGVLRLCRTPILDIECADGGGCAPAIAMPAYVYDYPVRADADVEYDPDEPFYGPSAAAIHSTDRFAIYAMSGLRPREDMPLVSVDRSLGRFIDGAFWMKASVAITTRRLRRVTEEQPNGGQRELTIEEAPTTSIETKYFRFPAATSIPPLAYLPIEDDDLNAIRELQVTPTPAAPAYEDMQ